MTKFVDVEHTGFELHLQTKLILSFIITFHIPLYFLSKCTETLHYGEKKKLARFLANLEK